MEEESALGVGRGSLQLRFILTVIVGATLFSAVAGGLAYRMGHRSAVDASRGAIEGLAAAVERTLAAGAYANDRVVLQEVVDGLARNDLVASVEVRSTRGELLARSERAGLSSTRRPDAKGSGSELAIDRSLSSPFDPGERVGVLHISADDERVGRAATQEAHTLALLMAGQAVLLAFLLYCTAAWLVSRPIVNLANRLRMLPPGTDDRLATPAVHRHDEIGVLIQGANALLDANARALQRERGLRAEVEAMELKYRQIFDSSSAGIFVLDASGGLINGNPTVSKVVGLSLAQLRALQHGNFVEHVFRQPEQVQQMIEQAALEGETVAADLELVPHGSIRRWVHCLISVQRSGASSGQSTVGGMVEGVVYDVTDRKRTEAAVRHQSEHDQLTGLKNRASSEAIAERFAVDAIAGGESMSLLYVDLDGFKRINDEFGHQAGDEVLVACAKRMKSVVRRSSDLVGRVGGDEFLVVLREVGSKDSILGETASNLISALREPIVLGNGKQVGVGASIGIACLVRHGSDAAALRRAADEAMYEVKRSGKNSFAMAVGPSVFERGAGHS